MLYRNIFITKHLHLILCRNQYLIQILSHIRLTALYLRTLLNQLLHPVQKGLRINFHLFDHLGDQTVIKG